MFDLYLCFSLVEIILHINLHFWELRNEMSNWKWDEQLINKMSNWNTDEVKFYYSSIWIYTHSSKLHQVDFMVMISIGWTTNKRNEQLENEMNWEMRWTFDKWDEQLKMGWTTDKWNEQLEMRWITKKLDMHLKNEMNNWKQHHSKCWKTASKILKLST